MITDKEFSGNGRLKQIFDDLVISDRFPHAVLLSGEDGMGRNLFARLIARDYLKDLNGLSLRHVHPDCIEIKGSGASGEISVDSVRSVSYEVNKAAVMTDMRRVVIIEDGGNLNPNSSAALLKTLEQPPREVVFLITVASPSDVIETIRSRCVTMTIMPPMVDECIEYVTTLRPDAELISEYSILFRGRIGYVLKALDSEEFRQTISVAEQFVDSYLKDDELMMCSVLDGAENRKALGEILQLVVFCIAKHGNDEKVIRMIKQIEDMKNMLARNVSVKLFSTVFVKQMF